MTNNEKYESIAKLIIHWCDGLKTPYILMGITEATPFIQEQYPNVKYSSGICLFSPNKLGHGDVLFLFDGNKDFQGIQLSHVLSNRLSIIKNDRMFYGIPYRDIKEVGLDCEYNNVHITF